MKLDLDLTILKWLSASLRMMATCTAKICWRTIMNLSWHMIKPYKNLLYSMQKTDLFKGWKFNVSKTKVYKGLKMKQNIKYCSKTISTWQIKLILALEKLFGSSTHFTMFILNILPIIWIENFLTLNIVTITTFSNISILLRLLHLIHFEIVWANVWITI